MILECFEYNQHFVAMMNIINHAKLFNKEGKFEKHHIIPRCFYKNKGLEVDNSSSNLVNLTYEEHKKVHQLAYLCAKDIVKVSLKFATCLMNRNTMIGENNPMFGQNHSLQTKKKMSDSMKGRKCSDEHRKKISESNKGRKISNEHRKKLSNAKKGKGTCYKGKHWKLIDGKRVWCF